MASVGFLSRRNRNIYLLGWMGVTAPLLSAAIVTSAAQIQYVKQNPILVLILFVFSLWLSYFTGKKFMKTGHLAPKAATTSYAHVHLDVRECVTKGDVESHLICLSKKLESFLVKHFGAEGTGLHEYLNTVEHKLDEKIVRKMRKLASIRNRSVHDSTFDIRTVDRKEMQEIAEDAQYHLMKRSGIPIPPATVEWSVSHMFFYVMGLLTLPYAAMLAIFYYLIKHSAAAMLSPRRAE
ncbi:MAG: hypothetical protein ACOZAI_08540 [Pseudomonadota bacterium]